MENRYPSAAIICEYNPFHYGHAYQIAAVKRRAEVAVGIMSGAFVQRGYAAVADKYSRAAAALEGGLDLVIELPFPYCVSAAPDFAAAGVRVAAALGVRALAFGCEDGEDAVLTAAAALADGSLKRAADELLAEDKSLSHPRAMQKAAQRLLGANAAAALAKPNNILAAEYVAAILREGFDLKPMAIKRDERYLSSTAIRESGDFEALIPYPQYFSERRDLKYAERLVLHALRTNEKERFYGVDPSFAARLKAAARDACSLEELTSAACGKVYTAARVRRAVLAVWLDVSTEEVKAPPVCTCLLAANEKGRAFLRAAKKSCPLAVVTKPADYKKHPRIIPAFERMLFAEECAALCAPRISRYGEPLKAAPIVI